MCATACEQGRIERHLGCPLDARATLSYTAAECGSFAGSLTGAPITRRGVATLQHMSGVCGVCAGVRRAGTAAEAAGGEPEVANRRAGAAHETRGAHGDGARVHPGLHRRVAPAGTSPVAVGCGASASSSPVGSSRGWEPHMPREDGLTHPADTSRSNLASALSVLWRRQNP